MAVALRYLIGVARFTVVDVAHELRMDYERGVFSRQTLAVIGGSTRSRSRRSRRPHTDWE
ncbi:hypothetical protein [Natronorubrum sulfidifaciens]|uniref:hypothetical protein n=1 Tax=Natronorubrum sulfidifaciens TaxID=388259 RepID=UPI001F4D13DF|nr:hypothetical protein [Natronorubrum sulfidifaciens]